MGLEIYLCTPEGSGLDTRENSLKYPTFDLKRNYLFSAHNPSGLNATLRRVVGMDLYQVFEPERYIWQDSCKNCVATRETLCDYPSFVPDWRMVKQNAHELLALMQSEAAKKSWELEFYMRAVEVITEFVELGAEYAPLSRVVWVS